MCTRLTWAVGLAAAAMGGAGCTLWQYRQQADRAAYAALRRSQKVALGKERAFSVDYRPMRQRSGDGAGTIPIGDKQITLGKGKPQKLTLDECLAVACRNNRSFQDRKEELYSAALALANARRSWDTPLVAGLIPVEADWEKTHGGGDVSAGAADPSLSLTQRLVGGGLLTLGLAMDFATDFTGMERTTAGSLLEANLTQPLLRGAWRGLAYEDQYRLERDFLIAVFDYERFTQSFAVDIVVRYYRVLQQRDTLANEQSNIERLKQTLALTRVLARGGQVSRIQEDEAEQDLLNAQVRYEANQQEYRDALDQFKLTLGLPIEADVELDYPAALKSLNEAGPKEIGLSEADAIVTALLARPDVLTRRSALRDAVRDVEIAADQFYPQLDVTVGISAANTGARDFWRPRFDRHKQLAAAVFNYELDQTDNRDEYRLALIAEAKARRDLEEFEDGVRLEVRQAYRGLLRSRRSYELQRRRVQIAIRRRKLAALEQKEGEASARDVLLAEEALRDAQNGLTSALINYATTRLRFLAQLGMLETDEKGGLHERVEPFRFDRIRQRYGYVGGD